MYNMKEDDVNGFLASASSQLVRLYQSKMGQGSYAPVTWYRIVTASVIATILWYLAESTKLKKPRGPLVGKRYFWEPAFVVGMRFAFNSRAVLNEGYQKYGERIFKIRRNDGEFTILPRRYIEELRNLGDDTLSAKAAILKKIIAQYTIGNVSIVRDSNLHRFTIVRRLTPALGVLTPDLKHELDHAMSIEVPCCEEWTAVKVQPLVVNNFARLFGRVLVGPELCRDPEWLRISLDFIRNLQLTRHFLHLTPSFLRTLVVQFIPHYHKIYAELDNAKRLLGPVIQKRRETQIADPTQETPNDVLQWMMDDATEEEGNDTDLIHRTLLLGLASIHSSAARANHFLHDICLHPQYIPTLREEIIATLSQDGTFTKTTLRKLVKLDSFLKESMRLNPTFTMTFMRIARKDIILHDGIKIPAGTSIAVASDAIAHDTSIIPKGDPRPDAFDPFRYSRIREDVDNPEDANRWQFATTNDGDLPFGHGIWACPGRFLASNAVKLLLVHLLMKYEFKYAEGQTKPPNIMYEENMAPNPEGTVLMKRREVEADIAHIIR